MSVYDNGYVGWPAHLSGHMYSQYAQRGLTAPKTIVGAK